MSQLTFKFPFKTTYYEKDFYVSSNNFTAYKLVESCPDWPDKRINIFGPKGCGKTHLANILGKKIDSLFIRASELNDLVLENLKEKKCLIIDDYQNNIVKLNDLKSRFDSFIQLGIDLPTDDLLRVILTKSFSDKQIKVNIKLLDYILKNIDRTYENVFKFIKDIDTASLSAGKSININLIKKVLKK